MEQILNKKGINYKHKNGEKVTVLEKDYSFVRFLTEEGLTFTVEIQTWNDMIDNKIILRSY